MVGGLYVPGKGVVGSGEGLRHGGRGYLQHQVPILQMLVVIQVNYKLGCVRVEGGGCDIEVEVGVADQ